MQYFCIGGTLIGAVRHQGFIPWDDNIDVVMPRPDYDRLIELSKTLTHEKYEVIYPKADSNYYMASAKMRDKSTTLIESKDINFNIGLFMDIFPLDGVAASPEQRKKDINYFNRLKIKLKILSYFPNVNLKEAIKRFKEGHYKSSFAELLFSFFKPLHRKKVIMKIDKFLKKYSYDEAKYIGFYSGAWGEKEFWRKELFCSYREGVFENVKVRIPIGYDEILRQVYGDYMSLPPVEKQKSHHNFVYVNLDNRL